MTVADIEEGTVSTTPTITIDGFTYEHVVTERRDHYSSGTDRETRVVRETLVARFVINGDAEPYVRSALTNWRYIPEQLHVEFKSMNYGEWTVDTRRCFINGNTVQTDGSRGHQSVAHWFEWPDWGRALIERGSDGRSAVFDWIQTQYPRQAKSA